MLSFHVLPTLALGIFVVLLTVVTVAVSVTKFRRLASENTQTVFSLIAERNADELRSMLRGAVDAVNTQSSLDPRYVLANGSVNRAVLIPMLVASLRANPRIYSLAYGFGNGRFFEVIGIRSPRIASALRVPPGTEFAVRSIEPSGTGKIRERWDFLAANAASIGQDVRDSDYVPGQRPWFIGARVMPGVFVTRPYLYDSLQSLGLTLSRALPDGVGVFAANLSFGGLERYAEASLEGRQGGIVVTDDRGNVLAAHSDRHFDGPAATGLEPVGASSDPLLAQAVAMLTHDGSRIASVHGEDFVYASRSVQITPEAALHVVAFTPASLYTGAIDETRNSILLFDAAMLLVFLPLTQLVARRITGTLERLTQESERLQRLDFSGESRVRSRFYEIDVLGAAQHTMKVAIRERTEALDEARVRLRALMESLIRLIAGAIDAKSEYTGGHCERVPELARMLAAAACEVKEGPLADFRFETEDQWQEFRIGTWLHDCGKVTTPEHVVDKATKLETIVNRIHEIRTRFEVLLRDAEIASLKAIAAGEHPQATQQTFEARRAQLVEDFAFIATCNIGAESMSDAHAERLRAIGQQTWLRHFDDRLGLSHIEESRFAGVPRPAMPAVEHLLADKPEHLVPRGAHDRHDLHHGFQMEVPEHLYNFGELHNLCVSRGTLTAEERYKVNEHIAQTIVMLEQLPLPPNLQRVPEYAGTHHESLTGTGYPRGLGADALSVPARIMAIADIFEALTASDRPYKKAKPLSEAVQILAGFKARGHIDSDLFDLFLTSGVCWQYAKQYLPPEQIDEIDVAAYLNIPDTVRASTG
jgi:HD-GYP domain-containing protein (c-di-GMP phosphodiesterase class II)